VVRGIEAFADLADDYAKYRPGYPVEVLDELVRSCGLKKDWVIADVGSGPGNLTRVFLEAGYQVIGVEPNREMREAGERLLGVYPNFRSMDGTAENIPLDSSSVDLIAVAHALHWFDIERTRTEFLRILRPGGWVAVMWNERPTDVTPFALDYKEFACYCTSIRTSHCNEVTKTRSPKADLTSLFGQVTPQSASFPHMQRFDLKGLLGRARSSDFIPQPGEPHHAELTAMLTDIFSRNRQSGVVEFHYMTQLRFGRLTEE
jgi:ubiquinone/menaquinone biosynthesis C-methylase UbiE